MKKTHAIGVAMGLGALLSSGAALAQQRQPYTEPPPSQEPYYYGAPPATTTPWGMQFTIGGGVVGFTGKPLRDYADVGGLWAARFAVGTRRYIGAELSYVGTAQSVDAVGLDPDAILLGTNVQLALRVNFLTGAIQPFVTAGVGWRHYNLTRKKFNTSVVADSDDQLIVPLELGLAYRFSRLVLDVRGGVTPAFYSDLIRTPNDEFSPGADTWNVSANLGWEF